MAIPHPPPSKVVVHQAKMPKPLPRKLNKSLGMKPQNRGVNISTATSAGLTLPKYSKNPSQMIDKRLRKTSPWFSSIVDPLHGADVKIPDATGIETGTTQIVEKLTFTTTGPTNVNGFRVISPLINSDASIGTSASGANYQFTQPALGIASPITWQSATAALNKASAFAGVTELKTIADSHRVVSAAIYVQSEGASATLTGEMVLFSNAYEATPSALYSEFVNNYKSMIIPLNQNRTGKVCWYPLVKDVEVASVEENYDYKAFTSLTEDDYVPWEFGVLIYGAPSGTTFRVTVVVNYEFIPKFNVLNILDASPSPQDVTESDLVMRWVQDEPLNTIVPDNVIDKPASAAPVQHEDDISGFGMMFNVIKELAPLALSLL